MKRIVRYALWLIGMGMIAGLLAGTASAEFQKIKVLVVTGGHDFEPAFITVFDHPDIEYTHLEHPKVNQIFTDGTAQKYDVIVLYDLWQDIADAQKQGLLDYLKAGKGLVSLHHSIANYQNWPEYMNVTGVRYVLDAKGMTIDGKLYPQAKYQHDVPMDITVADPNHPITKGLSNFKIVDESYKDYYVSPKVHMLLTTNNELNNQSIAWTNNYNGNDVVFIQLGHDSLAYFNPSYRHLVAQAIRYTAKRPLAVPLFNGKDLSGCTAEGNADWKWVNGELVGKQGKNFAPGDLFSDATYTDFVLNLEFRAVWTCNSGIWFRYQSGDTAYQADILEYKNPLCWSGSLYCPKNGPFIAMNENASLVKRYDWNSFAICCQKDRIVINLNGETTADVKDTTSAEGKIGIQVHPGEEFKNMEIHIRNAFILPLQ